MRTGGEAASGGRTVLGPCDGRAGRSSEIVRDAAGLDALAPEWRALESRIDGAPFFASFEWTRCWWRHFGRPAGARLAVVAVRRDGRLEAVAPLVVELAGPYAWASVAGEGSGRYSDVAIDDTGDDPAAIRASLWSGICSLGADALIADNVREDSSLARLLAPRRKIVGTQSQTCEIGASAYSGIDAYLATCPPRFAKTMRRRRRRLGEEGAVRYEVIWDRDAIIATAETVLAMKLAWLAERGMHGRFLSRPAVADWLKEVSVAAGDRLHLSVLKVDERIVAAQYAFADGRRFTCYLSAFDVAYARQGAGKLHLADIVRDAIDSRYDVDLMPPPDDYKREWRTREVGVSSFAVPLTPLGTIVTLVHNAQFRDRLKRLYLATPRAVRAGLAAGIEGAARRLITPRSARPVHGPEPDHQSEGDVR